VENLAADEIQFVVRDFEESGIPLLMQNWHKRPGWNSNLFSPSWLYDEEGDSSPSIYPICRCLKSNNSLELKVRNLYDREDRDTTLSEYLNYASLAPPYATDEGKLPPAEYL
jgi:hypothetical protein